MDLALLEEDTEESNITQMTPIQEFYKDCHILITGGSGFLGKLLIEKLLRSCHDLSKIYLIVRSKKGKDMPTRLKRQYPKFKQKIIGIAGDCALPNLGLASEDRKVLQDNVSNTLQKKTSQSQPSTLYIFSSYKRYKMQLYGRTPQ
nr:unnamed protein product [Callosobruchus chinensis]